MFKNSTREAYKIVRAKNIELREKNEELINYLKAILYRCSGNELEIGKNDIEEAKNHTLYVEDAYCKFAKKIKLCKVENRINYYYEG